MGRQARRGEWRKPEVHRETCGGVDWLVRRLGGEPDAVGLWIGWQDDRLSERRSKIWAEACGSSRAAVAFARHRLAGGDQRRVEATAEASSAAVVASGSRDRRSDAC
ncbi:uncharacterized protein A4U43_C05F14000 [Asparagus officinalis]|uniref:Uncharacterized protein n=1 Tax=Asparagus officinalis TaxID=4686 RepID=A0A5P1ERP4_ASPOF|nr:uncharacterized protein A4U43_C05F14000 [Asparagus officinalis]